MKLLDTNTLARISFADRPPFEYAFFSYTWSQPAEEGQVAHASLAGSDWPGHHTAGHRRVVQACIQARARGIRYLWVDSFCIDPSSSAELAESVTASFRLVWDAAICIAHLSDLSPSAGEAGGDGDSVAELEKAFSRCRWFTRSWTLQELIAARRIEFFDRDWNRRGIKASTLSPSWFTMLSRVSGVDAPVLADRESLFDVSLGRRLSWGVQRRTSRPEDVAYAMMGICGVAGHLSPRYGEGRQRAFLRLQEKILKVSSDLSILAWKRQPADDDKAKGDSRQRLQAPFSGLLAHSITDFRHFTTKAAWGTPFTSDCELTSSNRGWHMNALISTSSRPLGTGREVVLILNTARPSRVDPVHVGIWLREVEPGLFVRSNPSDVMCFPPRKDDVSRERICVYRHVDDRIAQRLYAEQKESRVSTWVDEASKCLTDTSVSQTASRPMSEQMATEQGIAIRDAAIYDIRHNDSPDSPRVEQRKRPSKRSLGELPESGHTSDSDSENDVLLFDSLPEKLVFLEEGHRFQDLVPNLVNLGLRAWNEDKATAALAGTALSANKRPAWSPLQLGSLSISFGQNMYSQTEREWQEIRGGGDSTGSYTAETDQSDQDILMVHSTPSDLFACPFFRLDPVRYHSCMWELELPDTRTIKQHLIVDHRLREHCPICYTVFDSAADRDQHIVARSCSKKTPPSGLKVGVSEDQVEELSRRYDGSEWKPKGSRAFRSRGKKHRNKRPKTDSVNTTKHPRTHALREQDKWFLTWDILFPTVPRPESPYLSSPRERDVLALRGFWQKVGHELVAGALEERRLLNWQDLREEATLAALHASVFKGMVELLTGSI